MGDVTDIVTYYRVGTVERSYVPKRDMHGHVRKTRLRTCTGYSRAADGGVQPWLTRSEAQAEAKREGKSASFAEPLTSRSSNG